MSDSIAVGLATVLLAGSFQGSFLLPSKWMRGWAWENTWLIFAASAYLVCPWVLALMTIPDLLDVYRGASPTSVVLVAVFGLGWGIGAVTFGLGIDALGLALGFAVILGVAAVSGALIPLLVMTPPGFTFVQGVVTATALVLMLLGVTICSFAGSGKGPGPGQEQEQEHAPATSKPRSYRSGLVIAIASGLLSACGNLGYAWGEPIYRRAIGPGVPPDLAPNALWPLLTPPLFLCNAGYALYLLRRNRTFDRFRAPGSTSNVAWAFLMGLMWLAGMALYGIGAFRLGAMGKSVGWAILMSTMVLVANALGVLTGEWKSAPARARRRLIWGIAVLLIAIAGLGWANSLQNDTARGQEPPVGATRHAMGTGLAPNVVHEHDHRSSITPAPRLAARPGRLGPGGGPSLRIRHAARIPAQAIGQGFRLSRPPG